MKMREYVGSIWDVKADWVVIPTNGFVKKDGTNVMGSGLAKQAADFHPSLPASNGEAINKYGNVPCFLGYFLTKVNQETGKLEQLPNGSYRVYSFPTKHHYREKSDIKLIRESCSNLLKAWESSPPALRPTVVMPRVGCGLGKLDWEGDVRPLLDEFFDGNDKFIIAHNGDNDDPEKQQRKGSAKPSKETSEE